MINYQMDKKSYKLIPQDRLTLMRTLNSLPSQQLDELIVSVEPPGGLIPPSNAPQGDRTAALIRWAESPGGRGLKIVQELLERIIPDDEEVLQLNCQTYKFDNLLSLLGSDEKLRKEIPNFLQESDFYDKIDSQYTTSIINNAADLRYTLVEKTMHCSFLKRLDFYLTKSDNKEKLKDVIEGLENLKKAFAECKFEEPLPEQAANEEMKSYLQILVKQISATEAREFEVSAILYPNIEKLELDTENCSPIPFEKLKESIESFIDKATEKRVGQLIRVELFLSIDILNKYKVSDLIGKDYLETYPVTTCFYDYLQGKKRSLLQQRVIQEINLYNKSPGFNWLFGKDPSSRGNVDKEKEILEFEIIDRSDPSGFANKVKPTNLPKPIVIKIRTQQSTDRENNESVLKDLMKAYVPVIIWSTCNLSKSKNDEEEFGKLLALDIDDPLESLYQNITTLRGRDDSILSDSLNVLYTDLNRLKEVLKSDLPLSDEAVRSK